MNKPLKMKSAKGKGCLWALFVFMTVTGIVLWVNWDRWFGDLPEPDFSLSNLPQRVYLLPGQDGTRERTITWIAGDSIPFQLQLLGLKSGLYTVRLPQVRKVVTGGGVTYIYSAHLPELVADDIINYQIRDSDGQKLYEDFFVLRKPRDPVQRFVFIGDIQDKRYSRTDAFVREVSKVLPGADAWLFVGDQIERPHDRFWALFYSDVKTVAGKIPFIPAPGNHEYQMGLNFDLGDRFPFIFEMPKNGPETPEGLSYYVDYPFARIVVLDTNIYAWYHNSMNDWLRKVLTGRQDHPFLIVMGHHPIFSVRKGRNNFTVDLALQPLMEELGVHLYLSGHDHAYSRNEEGGVAHIVSASSAKTYPVGDPSEHLVSRSGTRFFVGLEVARDTLRIRSYAQGEPLPFDSLTIIR